MNYWIITYGCQMNKSDSERIAAILESSGHKTALKIEGADLVVVNMCSVRQSAVNRVYGLIEKFKKLKKKKPKLKTILTGCILKKDRQKFAKGFDQILKFEDLLEYRPENQNKNMAFIPISNGCNNFCAYCVVPFTRGNLICRDHKKILEEAKNAVQNGFKEIWLLGQNVNDYQDKFKIQKGTSSACGRTKIKMTKEQVPPAGEQNSKIINFARLIKMVNDIPGEFKFFFMSPHPKNFSDELINTLAECQKFGKYLNLPVQSGNNQVLKKMNRNYTIREYKNLVNKIKKKIPEINLSTDVIVGFPGETEKQFQDTVKLFKEIKFNNAYISKYSPRSGTAAWQFKDALPIEEKKKREKILRELIKKRD